MADLTEHLRLTGMPAAYTFEFTGRAKMLKQTNSQLELAFVPVGNAGIPGVF